MARPKGYRLNRAAFDDVLTFRGLSMTEAADRAGLNFKTVSSLATGKSKASSRTALALADGIGCSSGTLFPELVKFADASEVAA